VPTAGGAAEAAAFARGRPYVVLHPGSGDNFPGRRWSEAGFAAAGRAAIEAGRGVVVTGSASEADLARRVAAASGAGATSAAGGLRVEGLVALVAGASALVSNDTGPVHLASALGVPTLAVFGPNTPVLYGPLAPGSRAFWRGLPCSPCLSNANYRSSRCRIHTCMASVPVGEVVGALSALLRRDREEARWPAAPAS
jgi:ADP-heptose:LPS heptosyltransferase